MENVFIGQGELDGKGLYAARDFERGEVIVAYQLHELSREAFRALPVNEQRLSVHSYSGRRFLYPVPVRYVNHSANPCAYEDFDHTRYTAPRPVRGGEPITIDALQETDRELATFMNEFERATNAGEPDALAALVDDQALLWLPTGSCEGKARVVRDLRRFRAAVGAISFDDLRWMVGSHRWEAACSCRLVTTDAERSAAWHATTMLKVIEGNWQLIYAHVGAVESGVA